MKSVVVTGIIAYIQQVKNNILNKKKKIIFIVMFSLNSLKGLACNSTTCPFILGYGNCSKTYNNYSQCTCPIQFEGQYCQNCMTLNCIIV